MTTILVTGATGDTGRPATKELLKKGFRVRALARREDARSRELAALGAEIVYGDMMSLRDVRLAMEGVERAYFCFPLAEGLVEASVIFAQAAKERNVGHIVNLSHKQSRPHARSKATQNHWLSEQVFNWSGIPTTHLRVTFFAEWLLYISSLIQRGRYVMPYNRESRFAPLAAADTAKIIANILEKPKGHGGQAYQLHGPKEYSHEELAAEVSRVLGVNLPYEHVTVSVFLELLGLENQTAMRRHFEAVAIDQQEGRLAGVDDIGTKIIGGPLMTVEDFIKANRSRFAREDDRNSIIPAGHGV
ncbi:NmrA family NAD(P)-binding protein [Inquilinus sp.]|uniref:NmrA family NAD(P)-binding protein n=1 Tax=Inquilinus sp. TaxID=1932117 RepID=UPI0037834DFD